MLQEFTAFEHLPVTVTEADLLRDIQIHLPERIRFLAVEKNRFAEHASIDRIGLFELETPSVLGGWERRSGIARTLF